MRRSAANCRGDACASCCGVLSEVQAVVGLIWDVVAVLWVGRWDFPKWTGAFFPFV